METFLLILAALALLTLATGVVVTRRVVRAVRRQAGVLRDRAGITVRAHTGGSPGEIARLRLGLHRSVTGVRRALTAAQGASAPVGDVASLLVKLEQAAHDVDTELQMLEAPARGRPAVGLAGPRSRARSVTDAAGHLIDALAAGVSRVAPDLTRLQAECAIEAEALRGYAHDDQLLPRAEPTSVRTAW